MKLVRDYMKRRVVGVSPDTPVTEVWSLIFKKGIHGLPVINKAKKLVGIISDEDLLTKVYPNYSELFLDINNLNLGTLESTVHKLKKMKAKDVMGKIVFTTDKEASIFLVLSRMIMLQVRQMPVIEKDKTVIGMISKGDIFDQIFKDYLRNKFK